ncbi:MAG: spinster family MFS transporter, partial [Asticcacaulis sp.]
ALCGFTHTFWQLFLARMGVGVGEAGGVAPAYSLISDYFPPKERARAMAVYSFGIPIGSALGILFGGLLASLVDWRFAFMAVGFAGLLIAPVFRLMVKDPPRGQYDPKPEPGSPAAKAAPIGVVLSTILPKPSFWLISFGASCSSILGYGLIFWLPSFFQRSFGLSLVDRSLFMAGIIFTGGIIGIWIGGMLGDKLGGKHKGAYALIPAIAFVLSIPCYAFGLLSESLLVAFFVFLVPQALGLVWLGPVITAIQHLGPANMRATASALFLFINNLIGIGFGTVFFGMLSDYLAPRYGDDALKMSILFGLVFYALSAGFFFLASRRLKRDWVG